MGKLKLSAAFDAVTGQLGEMVVVELNGSPVARRKPRFRRSFNTSQIAAADRMKQASAVWNTLTFDQAQAWRDYADTLIRRDKMTGKEYRSSALPTFTALTTKLLQAVPEASVPLTPPTETFAGDSLSVSVSAGAGALLWTASSANSSDTLTELLIQKLPNARRSPTKRYTSAAFVGFTDVDPTFSLPVEDGIYACAFRFVDATTGQATGLMLCGLVEVVA